MVGMGLPAAALPHSAALAPASPTVVSFTFGGTFTSQVQAAAILSGHGMAGTFYINSGYIDSPAHLSIAQLRTIARGRHEIAGGSMYGNDLSEITEEQAEREVCDDRATLAQLGFLTTSFAYPHGVGLPRGKAVAQDCGYNNAREYAGLYRSADECSSCPRAESMPPRDDFRIRTSTTMSLADFQEQVVATERSGGGWLPLVFSRICWCSDNGIGSINPDDFAVFVAWLAERPGSTVVKTVDQVMGGPLKPVHGSANKRLVPTSSPAISTPGTLSKAPAWTVFGVGIGQSQILVFCVVLTITIVMTFRLASRGDRYVR